MKVVVAPNAFKGSLTAPEAAAAIARGVRQAMPDAEIVEVPVADGGDGTVEALVTARGGEFHDVEVEGPLGRPVSARYGLIDAGRTAVVELASASGLALISDDERDPRRASTFGFGQLLHAVRRLGVTGIVAGIGGSATNDGGAGMAQALGYRLLDAAARDLPRGGAALAWLERIDATGFDSGWRSVAITVACDVTNPLTGPEGASAVYGPQKGADSRVVQELDRALGRLADVIVRDLGKDVAGVPGAGAAGGAGAGLIAFLDASLVKGAPLVVEAAGLDKTLAGANLVITGEGQVDAQTAFGKAPGEVAMRAQAAAVPVLMLAGSRGAGWEELTRIGVRSVFTLMDERGPDRGPGGQNLAELMRTAAPELTRLAARAIREGRW
ncbi:MAG: glycerate kinase [Chloroflexi bacterium]|nr:MAG: glycerate kinase [Chloroflexota bacterium]